MSWGRRCDRREHLTKGRLNPQRVMAAEGELVAGHHDLSPLYRAGLRLMAEILAMDT